MESGSISLHLKDQKEQDLTSVKAQKCNNPGQIVGEALPVQSRDMTYQQMNKTKDNMADVIRLFYGAHEIMVSEGGEAELHKNYTNCQKNPGHKQFIPVNEFTINDLPVGYHDNELFELIKATAELTVRIDVTMVSTERPEFWPDTSIPFPFYDKRGSDVLRLGSGTVCGAYVYTDSDNRGACQCHRCQHTDTPNCVWAEIWAYTATHVVYDDCESKHTTCRLFYDTPDSPLVTLDGWTVDRIDTESDRCVLKCVTCDVDLLNRLAETWTHWEELWRKVSHKYKSCGKKLIYIVSHPHGCPKRITLGYWIDRVVLKYGIHSDATKYTYTTCTCPGSSGAYAHSLGYNWWYDFHVHSGVNSEGNNFCGAGRDWS